MRTLRAHLIVSRVLPLLASLSLAGILLIRLVETQVFPAQASNELEGQSLLAADLTGTCSSIWTDRARPQVSLDLIGESLPVLVLLLDSTGVLIATSGDAGQAPFSQTLDPPRLAEVVRTGAIVRVD